MTRLWKSPTISTCKRRALAILITASIIVLTASFLEILNYIKRHNFSIQDLSTSYTQENIRMNSPSSSTHRKHISENKSERTLSHMKTHISKDTLENGSASHKIQHSRNISYTKLSPHEITKDFKQDVEMFSKYSNIFKESRVNCARIFQNDTKEIRLGIDIAKKTRNQLLRDDYFINITKHCATFKSTRGYITSALSKQEKEFPIAFSILAYKDIEMVDRLLRQIYRPQNFYCLHIDLKANEKSFQAASAIANCFPNVFMASKRISVKWGRFSVLQPELVCMKDLYSKGKWKYFINLTGQEMPLKTNLELVKILTAYKGANDIKGSYKGIVFHRWKEHFIGAPPEDIRPIKGSVHIVANRNFVHYVLHSPKAAVFLKWVKGTYIPDETFFSTLNHNPHLRVPGSYLGWPETDRTNRKPFLARYKVWEEIGSKEYLNQYCHGSFYRTVCILSTGQLPYLEDRPEMFANKFHLSDDSVVVGCLEEKLFNSTRDEFLGLKQFNTTFYESLGFVINQFGRKSTKKFVQGPNIMQRPTTDISEKT